MTNQSRKTIMAALVDILDDVTGIKYVTDAPITDAQIPDDAYPAILLYEGSDVVDLNITSVYDITFQVGIKLINKTNLDDAYTQMEAIVDALIDNVDLDETCIACWPLDARQPFPFAGSHEDENYETHFDRVLKIRYRRTR